ncbi:MAG: BREX protein BrxB domain-containing protein [Candidatus Aenigmatarchaeota archaeon]
MKSLEKRFENLRKELENNYENFNNLADEKTGLFIYEPNKEKEVIKEVKRLAKKLKDNYEVCELSMFDLIFEALEELSEDGLEFIYSREKEDSAELIEDAHDPLLDYISKKIIENDKNLENGITLIYRCGAIYPFLRIHSITAKIENKLENPTMIFYPGKREGQKLKFLNRSSTTGDYRVKIYG